MDRLDLEKMVGGQARTTGGRMNARLSRLSALRTMRLRSSSFELRQQQQQQQQQQQHDHRRCLLGDGRFAHGPQLARDGRSQATGGANPLELSFATA